MTWLNIDTLDLKYRKGQAWRISDTCYVYDVQEGDILDVPFVISEEYGDTLVGYNLTNVTLEQVLERKALWIQKEYSTFYEALNEFAKLGAEQLEHINKHQVQVNITGRIMLVRQSEMRSQEFLQLAQNNPMQAMQYLLHRIQTEPTAVVPVVRDVTVVPVEPKPPAVSERPKEPTTYDVTYLLKYFKPLRILGILNAFGNRAQSIANVNMNWGDSNFRDAVWDTWAKAIALEGATVEAYKQIAPRLPRTFNQVAPLVTNWVGNHANAGSRAATYVEGFPDIARVFGDANVLQANERSGYNTTYDITSVRAFAEAINKTQFTNYKHAVYYDSMQACLQVIENGSVKHWCVVDLGGVPLVLVTRNSDAPCSFIGWTYSTRLDLAQLENLKLDFYAPLCVYSASTSGISVHGLAIPVFMEGITKDTLCLELPAFRDLPRAQEPILDVRLWREGAILRPNITWDINISTPKSNSHTYVNGWQMDYMEWYSMLDFPESITYEPYKTALKAVGKGFVPVIPGTLDAWVGHEPRMIDSVWRLPTTSEELQDTRQWVNSMQAPIPYKQITSLFLYVHIQNIPKLRADIKRLYETHNRED